MSKFARGIKNGVRGKTRPNNRGMLDQQVNQLVLTYIMR